jgi:PAS domain S-box-containing protein
MPDLKPFEKRSPEHLRLVIEAGNVGIWELDLGTGRASRNRRHDEIFGYPEPLDEWTYEKFLSHVVDADRDRVDALQKSAIARGEEWIFECRIRRADGKERWISAAGSPISANGAEIDKLIGHVIDITHTKEREARLSLLTGELNHRVRNMLAMINSMIHISASKAADIPSFARALEGRIGALARSQQIFDDEANGSVTPSTILERELAGFSDFRKRFRIETTDEFALAGSTSQGLALVFHELITNAVKYGSLSNGTGTVDVAIRGSEDSIRIVWNERGGPAVSPPASRGFGTMLISGVINPYGDVSLRYPETGFECSIEIEAAERDEG